MSTISKFSNTVEWNLKTTLDSSGISKLQAEIQKTQAKLKEMASMNLINPGTARQAEAEITKVQSLLNKSYNSRMGMLDMSTFTKGLKESGKSLKDIQATFALAGTTGNQAFNSMLGRVGQIDSGLKTVSKTTDKIFNTLGNTVRWGIIASGFQSVLNSIHESVDYVKDLDESLTNIMLVTDYSRDAMNQYAKSANEAAKALGSTTTAMTDATLVFAQQGFNLDKSDQLAQLSIKLANASQQDTATTSDQITAYMNAYGMDKNLDELSSALDKWAEVANISAADVEELATASQKAASTANTVGVNMDQLAAQIATIESVTREAPENIGNGLKTIYARFSDLKLGETLDDGVDLGQVTSTLDSIGVKVLDEFGNMRDMGNIMEDLMDVWGDLDQTAKAAVAVKVAGKFQLGRFEALMNRSDLYKEYKTGSENASGTLNTMNEEYVDSMTGKLNQLQATVEGLFTNLFESDDFYGFIDGLTEAVELLNKLIDSIGGAGIALTGLGAIGIKVFSTQISRELSNTIGNIKTNKAVKNSQAAAEQFVKDNGFEGIDSNAYTKTLGMSAENSFKYSRLMSPEQRENSKKLTEKITNLAINDEAYQKQAKMEANRFALVYGDESRDIFYDKDSYGRITGVNTDQIGLSIYAQEEALTKNRLESMKQNKNKAGTLASNVNAIQRTEFDELTHNADFANKRITTGRQDYYSLIDSLGIGENKNNIPIFKELQTAYEEYDAELKTFQNKGGQTEQQFKKCQEAAEKYSQVLQELTDILDLTDEEAKQLAEHGLKSVSEVNEKLATNQTQLEMARQEVEDQQITFDTQAALDGIVKLTGGVTSLFFAWQSFQNLGSIWENEDLDFGDKLSQSLMNVSMLIPMLISGFKELKQGWQEIVVSLGATSSLEAVQNIFVKLASTFGATGAASEIAAGGIRGIGAALKSVVLPIAIAIAALTALGFGIKALIDLYNADAIAAEKATTAAKELKNAYNDLKTSHEELTSNLEAYNEAKNKLEEMTEGTNEWNEQLQEVNNQLLDILEKYPELAQYVSKAANGALYINQSDLDAFLEAQEENLNTEQAITRISQQFADIAQQKVDNTYFSRTFSPYGDSVVPEGYVADANNLAMPNNYGDGVTAETLNKIYDAIDTYGPSILSNENKIAEILNNTPTSSEVQQIIKRSGDIEQQYSENKAASLKTNLILEETTRQTLESNEDFKEYSTKQQEAIVENVSKQFIDTNSKFYKTKEAEAQSMDAIQLGKAFASAQGLKFDKTEGNNYLFTDSSGEVKTFAKETIQEWYAAAEAMEAAADKWDEVASAISTIENNSNLAQTSGEAGLSIISSWQANGEMDISGLSTTDIKRLEAQREQNGKVDYKELFGDMSESEANSTAKELGFDSAESMLQSWSNGFVEAIGKDGRLAVDQYIEQKQEDYKNTDPSAWVGDSSNAMQIAVNTGDIKELNKVFSEGLITSGDYTKGIKQLGSGYSDLKKDVKNLTTAEKKYDEILEDHTTDSKEAKKAAQEVAKAQEQLEKKLFAKQWEKAAKSLEKYKDILVESKRETPEFIEALEEASAVLTNTMDINISSDTVQQYISNNLDLYQEWINGSEAAGSKIKANLIALSEEGQQHLQALAQETGMSFEEVSSYVQGLSFDVNGYADFTDIMNKLIALDNQTALSAGQMQNLANWIASIGASELVFENESGETHSIDTSGLYASDPIEKMLAYTKVATEVSQLKMSGGWRIKGQVPAGAIANTQGVDSGSSADSGSGGSGGGGGGSSYEAKTKDPLEEEIDRYEKVNTKLKGIENDFSKIESEKDRIVGYDRLDNMSEEIGLLERQIELHKEKLSIQEEEAKELQNELSSQYGVTFDSEGYIANYAAVHQQLTDDVNNLINQYNATSDEAGQEALDKQIEEAQERLDKFKDKYQRYDDLFSDEMKQSIQDIEDLKDKIENLRIEALKTKIEAVDNIKDIQETWIEFNSIFSGRQSDDPFRKIGESINKLSNYFDLATESANEYYDTLIARLQEQRKNATTDNEIAFIDKQIAMYNSARNQIGKGTMEDGGIGYMDMVFNNLNTIVGQIEEFKSTGSSTIFGEDSADLYEVAQDVYKQATEMASNLEDQVDELRDDILDAMSKIADELDRRKEQYQAISDELDYQAEISQLIYGENPAILGSIYAAQQENLRSQIKESQKELEIWKDIQSSMEQGSEEWKQTEDYILECTQKINELTKEAVQNLRNAEEYYVNQIMKQWEQDVFGNDLDWMEQEWELINRNADQYLDATNKAYNIQKLQGKYLELLDGSNDLHIQQQITDQMNEQLSYLREKTQLSEYDVAYANAQLEILQKQIALEEAQQNKSQMKLRRDSQGNYSYVYAANQSDIASKESDLLDAQNNAYNLSKENMKQVQSDALSAFQDAKSAVAEIWTDATLTLEKKKERTETILSSLKDYIDGCGEQLSVSQVNIINDFIGMVEMMADKNTEDLTEVYEELLNKNYDAFNQIDERYGSSLAQWLNNLDTFNNSIDNTFASLIDNAGSFQIQLDEIGTQVGTDFSNMQTSIDATTDKMEELNNQTTEFYNQLRDDAGIIKGAEANLLEYQKKISDITNEMKGYISQVNQLKNDLTAKEMENANLTSQVTSLNQQISDLKAAQSSGGSGSGSGNVTIAPGAWVGFRGRYYYDSWGQNPSGNWYEGQAGAVQIASYSGKQIGGSQNAGDYCVALLDPYGGDLGWVSPDQLFDTGGYTGQWSDGNKDTKNGKLAFLHQKELVLNEGDTANMLAAIDSVRNMVDIIKSGALTGLVTELKNSKFETKDGQSIDQQVHITAEFPGVKDSSEIEDALMSLNERAAQYAFKLS